MKTLLWMGCVCLVCSIELAWAQDEQRYRVFTRPDGTLIIVAPAQQARKAGESAEAFHVRALKRIVEKNPELSGLPYLDVFRSALPTDSSKSSAWRVQGGKVVVDATAPDRQPSKEQRRKDACAKIEREATASPGLKELCATF